MLVEGEAPVENGIEAAPSRPAEPKPEGGDGPENSEPLQV